MGEQGIHITVLGSGTSSGVPTVGCGCEVCTSKDPRDNRLRPSILIRYGGRAVLVDTSPDFRAQALRAHLERIDAILYTHSHADHILGLDDVRPFNYRQRAAIPVYGMEETLDAIRRVFRYAFGEAESNVPRLDLHTLDGEPFELFGLEFTPIRLLHGKSTVLGFRFGAAAYLTDHSDIPAESKAKLQGLDVLFLDALRYRPHPTHSTVERALEWVKELKPRRTFFTHMCHDLGHARTEATFPAHVRLAYDGLEIDVGGPVEAGGIRIARSLAEAAEFGPSALTIGNFDGVHAGHRYLFRQVAEAAREQGLRPTALTFDPHPACVVAPQRAPRLLTTPEERCALMREEGIEQVLILPFTAEVARLTPEEFISRIVVGGLGARVVLVGDNFRFGH